MHVVDIMDCLFVVPWVVSDVLGLSPPLSSYRGGLFRGLWLGCSRSALLLPLPGTV